MNGDVLTVTNPNGFSNASFSIVLPMIDTSVFDTVTLKYRASSTSDGGIYFKDQVYYNSYGSTGTFKTGCISADGEWHEDVYDISVDFPAMAGKLLTGIRLPGPLSGEFELEYIKFSSKEEPPVEETKLLDAAFDELKYDGEALVSEKAYTFVHDEANRELFDFNKGDVDVITFRGWAQLNKTLKGFGYKIDDGELVTGEFIQDRAAELEAAGKPGANGYLVDVPVDGLEAGDHTIAIYAIDEEDNAVAVVKIKSGVEYPVALSFTVTEEGEDVLIGDVNGDGAVNNKDVVALFKHVSNNTPANFVEAAADVNGDGAINNKDVVALFKIVSKV